MASRSTEAEARGTQKHREAQRARRGTEAHRGHTEAHSCEQEEKRKKRIKSWIQHHTVPGWSPTPVLSGLRPR